MVWISRIIGAAAGAFTLLYLTSLSARNWRKADATVDMSGKVVIVTGGNGGIGLETAKALYSMGAHVIIACRSEARAKAAVKEISASFNPQRQAAKIEYMILDTSSLNSVRSFTTQFLERDLPLDVLINNAGIGNTSTHELTAEGFTPIFATNYLGHFLLVQGLLDKLKQSTQGRIVIVSSNAHSFPKAVDVSDFQSKALYAASKISDLSLYSLSKLYNVLHCNELDRVLKASGCTTVTVNALCPGFVHTDISNGNFFGYLSAMFGADPFMGAQTSIHLATSPALNETSGKFFTHVRPRESSPLSRDTHLAKQLWDASLSLISTSE